MKGDGYYSSQDSKGEGNTGKELRRQATLMIDIPIGKVLRLTGFLNLIVQIFW